MTIVKVSQNPKCLIKHCVFKQLLKRANYLSVIVVGLIFLASCGSDSNSSDFDGADNDSDLVLTNDNTATGLPNSEVNQFSSIVNGFYLTRETTRLANGITSFDRSYILDSVERTLSRQNVANSLSTGFDVVHFYDESGLIVSRENRQTGTNIAAQTFNSEYDSNRRLIASNSFNEADPFLTGTFGYVNGLLALKELRTTTSGSIFSVTTYTYNSEGLLQSSALNAPVFRDPILKNYSFNVENRLSTVQSIDSATLLIEDSLSIEYDENGNVTSVREFDQSGLLTSTTTYEYTNVVGNVPNLVLHELVYEFDQL